MGIKIRNLGSIYNVIENSRKQYGRLRKCEFHIHTPASKNDYTLKENYDYEQYNKLSEIELLEIAEAEGYLKPETKSIFIKDLSIFQGQDYIKDINAKGLPYDSFKEYLTYKLIAHRLYKEQVEAAVITDHNTICGFKKLKCVISEYYRERKGQIENPVHLFLGVEISCSEKSHVIGIFNERDLNKVDSYLSDILMSQTEGTYYTGYQVLCDISDMGGVGYLAHVDTSSLQVSQAYKDKLYNFKNLKILGFSDVKKKDDFLKRIKPIRKDALECFCCINEGDSHDLENIGKKNIWIKFNRINFASLKKAINDYKICIYNKYPNKSNTYIKGAVVVPGQCGFLTSNPLKTVSVLEENDFIVDFSHDLNCIIGGRGTGKSTLLNLIETALTCQIDNEETLKYLSKHEQIYIVFCCDGIDYILLFIPLKKEGYEEEEIVLLEDYIRFRENNVITLTHDWIRLFNIDAQGITEIKGPQIGQILHKIYRRGYSINKLVSMINSNSIGRFIRNTVMYGINYQETIEFINILKGIRPQSLRKYLRENLLAVISAFEEHKKLVNEKICGYNDKFRNQIELVYSPKGKNADYYISCLNIQGKEYIGKNNLTFQETIKRDHVLKTYLTWDEAQYFIKNISESMGYLQFLYCLTNKKYNKIEEFLKLSEVIDKSKIKTAHINQGLEDVTDSNLEIVYDAILDKLLEDKSKFIESIQKYSDIIDDFAIRFNVNYKETVRQVQPLMKDSGELSLGQKVVSILTFVFSFGEYVKDKTPLVIDQPEDNLDSQYIYKNLVESLRNIKNKRQVIIVTHSSTIVTNADAEQVIVMESDNKKGWLQEKGYPSDEKIMRHILNYLEGGIESFKNKKDKYELFIRELES